MNPSWPEDTKWQWGPFDCFSSKAKWEQDSIKENACLGKFCCIVRFFSVWQKRTFLFILGLALVLCITLRGPEVSIFMPNFVFQRRKIQMRWYAVTVATTIKYSSGHLLTPWNQRWDQVPGESAPPAWLVVLVLVSPHTGSKITCNAFHSNMTWFFSRIKSTDTNWALFADNAQFPIQPIVSGFFPRSAVSRIGSVAVFWVPWVKLGHY